MGGASGSRSGIATLLQQSQVVEVVLHRQEDSCREHTCNNGYHPTLIQQVNGLALAQRTVIDSNLDPDI